MLSKPTILTARLMLEQETKGAWRYRELDENGNPLSVNVSNVGTIYLRKRALKTPPSLIVITIADDGQGQ